MDCSHDALAITWVPWRVVTSECDRTTVDRLERACVVGPSIGKLCLFSDLLGAPLCHVRHSLVPEYNAKILPSTGTEALKAIDA